MKSNVIPFAIDSSVNGPDSQAGDWWESAFKPAFSMKECRDILDLSYDANTDSSLTLPSDEIETVKHVKQVSQSIDNDRNPYRKIFREQRFATNEFAKLKSCLSESYLSKFVSVDANEYCDKSSQTKDCIWDAKEIKIIRSCIRDFKRRDIRLTAAMKELTTRNEELDGKLKLMEQKLQKKSNTLSEAVKANSRFHILSETLSAQLEEAKSHNAIIVSQKSDLVEQLGLSQLSEENLKREIMDKDTQINELQKALQDFERRFDKKLERSVSQITKKHDMEINSLQTKLSGALKDLFRERTFHEATNRGFQQLLKHYSARTSDVIAERDPIDITTIKYTNM